MEQRIDPLVADLVEWVAKGPHPYQNVMDAWRTSCPRLTVWEDAVDLGYVERRRIGRQGVEVAVTLAGLAFLAQQNRSDRREPVVAPLPA